MAAFAPPVRRDKFLYSSILYVDAGNDNHHPRATIAELTALLRPEPPNKSKKAKIVPTPEPAKDQVGHWYTAQLIHYGLPPTKDKNVAKVRLLNTLNEGKLEVPAWVTTLEAQLKKDWEAENRKLKKSAKDKDTVGSTPTPKNGTKKSAGRATTSTTQSMVQQLGINITITATQPPQTQPAKRKRDNSKEARSIEHDKRAKPKKSDAAAKSVGVPATSTPKTTPAPKPNAKAKSTASAEEKWPAPTKTVIPYHGPHFVDPDPYWFSRPATAPYGGVYSVTCPDVESDWPGDAINEFYLAFSASETEWWSRFRWGNFEGILFLEQIPMRVAKTVGVPFRWRARHSASGEDGEGTGKVFFTSKSTFKGHFLDLPCADPCHFWAKHVDSARRSQSGAEPGGQAARMPVLDQMRIEWGQMTSFMRDTPTKKAAASPKPRVKKEPSQQYAAPKQAKKASAKIKAEPQHDAYAQATITLSGTYKITCPTVTSMWPEIDPSSLQLSICKDYNSDRWWAGFLWGDWDMYIQIAPGPDINTLDQPLSVGWRLRDLESGELRFGRGCTGAMTFCHDQTIRAVLYDVPFIGEMEFWGHRVISQEIGRSADDYQADWDRFVTEAYGR